MKLLFFTFILLSVGLASCVGFFETTQPSAIEGEKKSKQQKAEESVEARILKSFGKLGTYKGFKFGDLYTLKPKEVVELDQLYELKKELPTLKENYPNNLDQIIARNDSAIFAKKKELKKKNIYPTYEISHIFKITSSDNIIKLYECKFTLYPDFKVKDVQVLMHTELDKKEDEMFYYFIMQYPLYNLENSVTTSRLNRETYQKFNKALENETENKARLLKTILSLCRYIRIHNEFNETGITKMLASKWIQNNPNYSNSYKEINFSELLPIDTTSVNDENKPVKIPLGYKLYHKFESRTNTKGLLMRTFQFDFDLNFVIINVTEIIEDEN